MLLPVAVMFSAVLLMVGLFRRVSAKRRVIAVR